MNKIEYQPPKYGEMKSFLEYIYDVALENPEIKLNKSIVYRLLSRNGLKSNDYVEQNKTKNVKEFFPFWTKAFADSDSLHSFCDEENWEYWQQFVSRSYTDEPYLKLYIPLDSEHVKRGAVELFKFVENLNVSHMSKVGKEIRNDNVVIRLSYNNQNEAMKIIEFVNKNPYLKEGLNKTNPFMPTINGVGYMLDDGDSYNGRLAECIAHYINSIIKNNEKPDLWQFYNYFISDLYLKNEEDQCAKIAMDNAMGIIRNQTYSIEEQVIEGKKRLIWGVIRTMYDYYGMNYAYKALMSIITKNDYTLISDIAGKNKHIQTFINNVDGSDLIEYFKLSLKNMYKDIEQLGYNEIVNKYLNIAFFEDQALKFQKACDVTLDNHGIRQLRMAIKTYCINKESKYFSRFEKDDNKKINYREEVTKIDPNKLFTIMKVFLINMGTQINNLTMDELVNAFTDALERMRTDKATKAI